MRRAGVAAEYDTSISFSLRFFKRILNLPSFRICVSNYNKSGEFSFGSGCEKNSILYDINFLFMFFGEFMADTIVEF